MIHREDGNDVARGHFVAKIPEWLRWLSFLPAAFLASVIGSTLFMIFVSFFTKTSAGSFDGGWYRLIQSAILGGLFVYVGAFVSPRAQMSVAIILLVIITILLTFVLSATALVGDGETNLWYQSLHMLAALAGAGAAIYSVYDAGAEFGFQQERRSVSSTSHQANKVDTIDLSKDELVDWDKIKQ